MDHRGGEPRPAPANAATFFGEIFSACRNAASACLLSPFAGEGNALQSPQLSAARRGSQRGARQLHRLVEFPGPQRRGNRLSRVLVGLGKGDGMASQQDSQKTKSLE